MKFYFYKNKTNVKEYSIRLIEKILSGYMMDNPADADYILVSICDITEISDIIKARQYNKPVITGGLIAEYPLVNELSDFIWHGEIYGFRDCLRDGVSIEDMPSITTRNKKILRIDQNINWNENPIIKVGSRAMYYYVSKGCPIKCKYCYIGNVRDYQVIPEGQYRQVLRIAGRNLMPISAFNPYSIPDGANIGEILLKKYITSEQGVHAKMIRSGVEFVTPDLSNNLAKGVSIEHFNEALARSKAEKTKMILYFIAGLEPQGALETYFSQISIDYATTPVVNVVFTYIDPQPFTPLYDFDLRRKIVGINIKAVYWVASQRNKRFRMLPLAGPEKSTIRTLLGRCESREDFDFVRSMSQLSYVAMIEKCDSERGWLLGGKTLEQIYARPRKQIIPTYWTGRLN